MYLDKESDNNGTMVGGQRQKKERLHQEGKGAALSSECATNEEKIVLDQMQIYYVVLYVLTLAFITHRENS